MGTYKDYLRNRKLLDRTRPEGQSIETRIDAAMDIDEAVKASWTRVDEFLAEYLTEAAPQIELATSYREKGVKESVALRIEEDVQQIASMAVQPNGCQAVLRLDDIMVLMDALWTEARYRGFRTRDV